MKSSVLLTAPVNPTLKNMTIPMMFGLVMLMSFNLVDTFYVSLLGTESLAAFSFTFPVTFTLISLAIGLGIGVSAVVAKTLGQKNKELAKQHASVALIISAVSIYTIAMFGLISLNHIFGAMGSTPEHIVVIKQYMTPWLFGCLFIIMPMIGNSVMRASGDTKTPAKVMGLGALLNAILDPIFIFGFGPIEAMGIAGAAIASIIASAVSCILVFYRLTATYNLLGWGYQFSQIVDSSKQILTIALPAAASNMMTPISSSIVISMVAVYGSEAVAAFGVGSRIESFAVIVILALAMSLPPFISQNFGAGQFDRVKQAYFSSVKFVIAWQLAIYLVLIAISSWLGGLFADDPKVADIIITYLMIVPVAHGLAGITILTNSSLNALHKPMISVGLNITRLFVLLLPLAYIGSMLGDINGLLVGVAVAACLSGAIAFFVMVQQLNKFPSQNQSDDNISATEETA